MQGEWSILSGSARVEMRIALSCPVARMSSTTTIDFSLLGLNKLPKVVLPIRSSL